VTTSHASAALTSLLAFLTGIALIIIPWSSLWDNNHFLEYLPHLRPVLLTGAARAAVTSLGIIDLFIGVTEARRLTPPPE
jgi:hypothetical protein